MKRILFPLMSLFILFGHASARTMKVMSYDVISSLTLAAEADARVWVESIMVTTTG
jgi:hypothetical protein